jgi:hypothetical protein
MRLFKLALILGALMTLVLPLSAASARLVKVLPQFVDLKDRIALNPSLYERDAYQVYLREHPEERAGLRFVAQWKSRDSGQLKLRVEMRGNRGTTGTTAVVENMVKFRGLLSTWSRVSLTGEAYKQFGELSAWRATLWDGDRLVSEQKSFLW